MKIITDVKDSGIRHIQIDCHYIISIDIKFKESSFKNHVEKYPVDYYVYPAFQLENCDPSSKRIEPLQYGTFYISATHHYTVNELFHKVTKYNALFSSFPSLY